GHPTRRCCTPPRVAPPHRFTWGSLATPPAPPPAPASTTDTVAVAVSLAAVPHGPADHLPDASPRPGTAPDKQTQTAPRRCTATATEKPPRSAPHRQSSTAGALPPQPVLPPPGPAVPGCTPGGGPRLPWPASLVSCN